MTTVVSNFDELKSLDGAHLGYSDWLEITQDRVNTFADATGDHQWIPVDVERARSGPFGGTIGHGYLTVSLLAPLFSQILEIRGISMGVNYGLNRVRFPAPVPVGSKLRLGATLAGVKDVTGGIEVVVDAVVEREGGDKPVCVAQAVYRYYT